MQKMGEGLIPEKEASSRIHLNINKVEPQDPLQSGQTPAIWKDNFFLKEETISDHRHKGGRKDPFTGIALQDRRLLESCKLSVCGAVYLYDNPLLKEPLKLSPVKPLVVGHGGTTPGQNFIYVHLNRVIKKYDLNMFYIARPGHGGPVLVANVYLEGTYTEIYPNISQDEVGLKKLFTQ